VIVAGQNGVDEWNEKAGIWLFGGLHSPTVPVILISDGAILVEQFNSHYASLSAPALCMYGLYTFLTGPRTVPEHAGDPPPLTTLGYSSSMDDLIDYLSAQGALPNTSATKATFALVPGSWHELTP
jgi:hypothetical protein